MATAISTGWLLLGAIIALAAVYALFSVAARAYGRFRGKRLVLCPETGKPTIVEIDAKHAAVTSAFGAPDLRIGRCSDWPERADCRQECLSQIEQAPEACLVRTLLAKWYEGKSCALCGKPFGAVSSWFDRPALMGRDRVTHECGDVPAEKLAETLSNAKPVCWSCHVAETFRRVYPDLPIERPRPQEDPSTTRFAGA